MQPKERLRRRAAMQLACERYEDSLILGFCGRTIDWPDSLSIPSAIALLDHISTSDDLMVGDFARRCATEFLDEQDVLGTLTTLVSLGYLARC